MIGGSAGRVPRGARAAAVAVAITALLAVAALASRARRPPRGRALAQTPFDQILDYLTVFICCCSHWGRFSSSGPLCPARVTITCAKPAGNLLRPAHRRHRRRRADLAVVVVRQLNERGWRPASGPDATSDGSPWDRDGRFAAAPLADSPLRPRLATVFRRWLGRVRVRRRRRRHRCGTRRRRSGLFPRAGAAAVVAGALE